MTTFILLAVAPLPTAKLFQTMAISLLLSNGSFDAFSSSILCGTTCHRHRRHSKRQNRRKSRQNGYLFLSYCFHGFVMQTIYQNKQHIEGSLIVGGWDKELGGQVYGVTIGGFLVDEKFHVDGSGSTYAWGLCDEMYKENMTEAEAQEFAMFTLSTAMGRDVASGGMARLVIVTATGGERKLIKPQEFPVYPGEMPFPKQDIVMTDS